jgi:outer membrane protein assembly factor BamA
VLATLIVLLASTTLLPAATVMESGDHPKGWFSSLRDPEDGWLDVSGFLDKPFGFFPMVSPITEPAVGGGAALVPVFIDNPPGGKGKPNIWALGAMRTSNGSQGLFGGYSGYTMDQRLHLLAGAMQMSVNLDFNGLGKDVQFDGEPMRYNLDMIGGLVGADWKLGKSHWSLGLRFLYAEVSASFVRREDRAQVSSGEFARRFGDPGIDSTISALQPTLAFDTRDNIFTPTKGGYSELILLVNGEALGGSSDFQLAKWTGLWYHPLVEKKWFLGLRGELMQSFGDVPFYGRPAVQLRGTPASSVQGEGAAVAEVELRWQFHPRWSLVGFGGAGFTWTGEDPFQRTASTFTGGGGVRYLIARRYGLHMGLDVAWGDDGAAVYIQFGSAWMRP